MDLFGFLNHVAIWTIPTLFAICLHEVAHGRMARRFGDRTADMLGRLSLNPLRHIDPVGTLVVPGLLLALGVPLFGWAKPVPVATTVLRHPRLATMGVILAGPLANVFMAAIWCGVLAAVARVNGNETLINWIALMAQAGIMVNVGLALLNMLPLPPLDGGRLVAGLLPAGWRGRFEKLEPVGLFLVIGLLVLRWHEWLFEPAYRVVGKVITFILVPGA